MAKKPDEFGWIDANAKLPFTDETVLVFTEERGVQVGYIDSDDRNWVLPNYCSTVTHWQSLPGKPPVEIVIDNDSREHEYTWKNKKQSSS